MEVAKITISGTIGEPDERLESLLGDTGVGEYFSSSMLRSFFEKEAPQAEAYEITIDSPGGDVVDGFAMYDLIRQQSKPVTTIALRADSIASVVFLAGSTRKVVKGASFVIHNAWISPADLEPNLMLNAQTLDRIKDINEDADQKILAAYMERAGRDSSFALRSLMEAETSLNAEQLTEFNFATEIIEGTPSKALRAFAFNSQTINIKGETMSEERLTLIEKGLNSLKALLKGSHKAMLIQVPDGPELYVFSEDGEFEGKRAVIAEGGEPTEQPAPEGTHSLSDGREIVVGAGGMITEVREEAREGMTEEEMNAQIAMEKEKMTSAMEEERKAMEEEKQQAINALRAEYSEKFEAFEKELNAFKNEVPGDQGKETPEAEDFSKLTKTQRILALRKQQRNS